MISKRSSLGNSKFENQHRIWVWIVTAVLQIMCYPGLLEIYLSRALSDINASLYARGAVSYGNQLTSAVRSALCFSPHALIAIVIPAMLIAIEEFAYLDNRSAVDFYCSIPVSARKKYINTYFGGMAVYIVPLLGSCVISALIAAGKHAFTADIAETFALSILFDIAVFLSVYGLTTVVVMFTGNMLTSFFASAFALIYPKMIADVFSDYAAQFLTSASTYFSDRTFGWSVIDNYNRVTSIIPSDYLAVLSISDTWRILYPAMIRALITIIWTSVAAYFAFMKRPAETAGRCLSTGRIATPLKLLISIPAGLEAGVLIYSTSNNNMTLMIITIIISTFVSSMLLEVLFEFDVHAAFRHIVPAFVSLAAAVLIFVSVKYDIFGYDRYVPKAENVDSYAIYVPNVGGPYISSPYYQHLGMNGDSNSMYVKDHMFLKSNDAICALQKNSIENYKVLESGSNENTTTVYEIDVYYRMKDGSRKIRKFYADLSDKTTTGLMQKIINIDYVNGQYQFASSPDDLVNGSSYTLTYSNGYAYAKLDKDDFRTLRQVWIKDAEQHMTFDTLQNSIPCGMIDINYTKEYSTVQIPVYESFSNTLSWLEDHKADIPKSINPDDIASIAISYCDYITENNGDESGQAEADQAEYNNQSSNAVYSDPKEIAKIVPALYPQMISTGWNLPDACDQNYSVDVTLKSDVDYLTDSWDFYCSLYSGQVPDFVRDKLEK